MERYLLFDSGCGTCSQVAQKVEHEAEGWLLARSLHSSEMQKLLDESKPDWQWQPTLLEINDDKASAFTGIALTAKIVSGLGLRSAWRTAQIINQDVKENQHQDRRNFLRYGGVFLASLPLLGIPSLRSGLLAGKTDLSGYQTYSDPDFGFKLQYPVGWQTEVKEQQPIPLIDEEAILKRVAFASAPALVYLDIWQAHGKDLPAWLAWYAETRLAPWTPKAANSTVAGRQAATFVQEGQRDLLITYFSDGKYVYRLLNWMTDNPDDLEAYWHMLKTFTLEGKSSLSTTEISLLARQNSIRSVKRSTGKILVNNCCNHTDSGNPFPCCGCPDCCACEQEGNCTWWVYFQMGGVPFTGNAGTWWGQAKDYVTWDTSDTPSTSKPNIACWTGSPGHVTYAGNYSGGTDVDITEMSWCDFCDQTREISIWDPTGFAYRHTFP